jgi:peptidoglycan hydrolase-like protein with peptidoglycan-binding domain
MFLQIAKPEKGDPFFNNAAGGGISTAITADSAEPGLNVLPNCVGGAVGAFNKAACKDLSKPEFRYLSYPPNAENILARAEHDGLTVSQKPAAGCLIVWQKGATLTPKDGAGHVAFVYKVDADGTIYTSESEWHGRAWVNRSYKPPYFYGADFKVIGFVLQPSGTANPYPAPVRVLKSGSIGVDVKWLQWALERAKCLDSGGIDGSFGHKTERALVYFQFLHGLEIDGICGPQTAAELEHLT